MRIRRHGHDDRWQLFLNSGLIILLGAFAIIMAGLLPGHGTETVPATGARAEASKESAEAIAREFLTNIGELPAEISSAKIERYWVPANNYWEQGQQAGGQEQERERVQQSQPSAQETVEEPPYLDCWVVTFYYQGLHPDAWKTVFVDVASGAVIGGADCRH